MSCVTTLGRYAELSTGPVPSLAVINSASARLENGKLTLTGVSPNAIVFADRPVRAAGHVPTQTLLGEWTKSDADSFAKSAPNATISAFGEDGKVRDAVEFGPFHLEFLGCSARLRVRENLHGHSFVACV